MGSTPLWTIVPFVAYLLAIALMPISFGRFWQSNRNKLAVALLASSPVVMYLLSVSHGGQALGRAVCDYLSFVAVLAALFTISGGVYLRGALVGTPLVNTAFLFVGAILGSVIGTTGASVLLVRPLLRANERRASATHVVVFFIFIVSNASGLLTPLGDPPLFLGFLRGVPFTWTLRLAPQWALVNGALLVVFAVIDQARHARERRWPPPLHAVPSVPPAPDPAGRLRVEGALNFVWLAALVLVVFLVGALGGRLGDGYLRAVVPLGGTLALAALSFKTTAPRIHELNRFSWDPLAEVAAVFVGIFLTMVPALSFLAERGSSLGITKPWHFFWASGALSSVLDNAPTYLAFASLATGVVNTAPPGGLTPADLGALAAHPLGGQLLAAVSCGAVLMGAVTYMGNGPNFMVKAIAERHDVRMPSFFGYMLWSIAILLPLFGVVSRVFF